METYLLTFSAACLAALLDGTANLINHCQPEASCCEFSRRGGKFASENAHFPPPPLEQKGTQSQINLQNAAAHTFSKEGRVLFKFSHTPNFVMCVNFVGRRETGGGKWGFVFLVKRR